uniref:Putative secreted protein n=1 Tax=Ixodes ricinus TaxID=34613 RepID=A0A6B0U1F9_IXORI
MRRASWAWASGAWTPARTACSWCFAPWAPWTGPGSTVRRRSSFTTSPRRSASSTTRTTTACVCGSVPTASTGRSGRSRRSFRRTTD